MPIQLKSNIKKLFLAVAALLLIVSFSSCGKNVAFQNSSIVPAAKGNVSVKKDSNKNYSIKVKITNLAEVTRLQPSKSVYVVWMETEEALVKNIGQIKSDSGFMSSKLKASFETVTSFEPSKIFITAEDQPDVQYPGMQLILSTNRF
ncbi:hypothetical protein SAMN05444395_10669 [Flavobacterium fryxellicola]|uniref:Anti-sigma factor n=1 Tax=Flavobacterium fryxellicola TaxID=249352 RepID=A0A162P8N0_9FLAO|nr:hypothetical protein [Flavobacterium fryxellicola]OAB29450.1 hypothetical protein FBFR_04025 [Flavobacterium fryxellicola]SHN70985.1 hypothetical protein SAMN05444395_10669 [Flavobacterium fryxellicola]